MCSPSGESQDDKHRDWIEVTGVHWGVYQPKSATAWTGGGHTAERGRYFEDLHPEPGYPRYQKDELGVVVYLQGTECKSIDSARAVFDSRDFQEISQPVLRQLADDLAAHLVRALGGKNQLQRELRNQHLEQEQLPQELREAFAPYFGK